MPLLSERRLHWGHPGHAALWGHWAVCLLSAKKGPKPLSSTKPLRMIKHKCWPTTRPGTKHFLPVYNPSHLVHNRSLSLPHPKSLVKVSCSQIITPGRLPSLFKRFIVSLDSLLWSFSQTLPLLNLLRRSAQRCQSAPEYLFTLDAIWQVPP